MLKLNTSVQENLYTIPFVLTGTNWSKFTRNGKVGELILLFITSLTILCWNVI